MSTEEFKGLLDRDLARVSAKDLIAQMGPLLTELVNHASWAFQRCQTDGCGRENVDVAPFILYRHIIEMIDGIHVLLNESCAVAAIPILRASFEASLGLDYILSGGEHYAVRSLSWLYASIQRKADGYIGLDPATQKGSEFKKQWENADFGIYEPPLEIMNEMRESVAVLSKVLEQEEFGDVKAAIARARGSRMPEWYSLFGGPRNVRDLAKRLNQGHIYDMLYRRWSMVIHAGDYSIYMNKNEVGAPTFKRVRYPENLGDAARLAANFMLHATRIMVEKFRPGEDLRAWYLREIRAPLLRIPPCA